jgi:hypothetical protein
MAAAAAHSFGWRLRNAVAFVAIVWGIAATFIAFEVVSLSGLDLALSYPALFGNVALSRAVTQSTSCTVGPGETSDLDPPRAASADARVGAWLLGIGIGRAAVLRQFVRSNPRSLDQMAAGLDGLAGRLGVPPPAVFRPERMANANTEFVAFVEQDAGETAHRFAVGSSPQACELFKLGALWGYSEMVRPTLLGERAVFAMEIRHHAQRAEVPESLWNPMLQRIPADAKREEVIEQMTVLTNGVTTYLARQR